MPTFIEDVKARQILDSRGNPTVEVDVKKNIVGYCKKINQEFFNGLLPFIIILTGIIAIKPKKSYIKMNGEMVLLVTPILIY